MRYRMKMTIEVPRDRLRIKLKSGSGMDAYNAAGMINDEVETAMREDIKEAAVLLNSCS
jgi:hypothetical protein